MKKLSLIPEPLQRQIIARSAIGIALIVLAIGIAAISRDIILVLPAAAITTYLLIGCIKLYTTAVKQQYIIVYGTCVELRKTSLRKHTKELLIETEDGPLLLHIHGRIPGAVTKGTQIALYVFKDTPVYQENGSHILFEYLAISIEKPKR